MPKVNTFNYDTIASWNGSQDLFVVEQPDGTKVATPAMVKQFIEAGDFEATGEVKDGHGNILKDMAKTADVDAEITQLNTALDGKCSVTTYSWSIGNVTAGGVYLLENFKNTVGLSDKNIVAVGLVNLAGSANYDYCTVIFSSNTVRIKTELTQNNATARLYIIYTD